MDILLCYKWIWRLIEPLYQWLNKLDKNKQYFTIVQYASGIYIKEDIPNLIVFSGGGGGLNYKDNSVRKGTFIVKQDLYSMVILQIIQFL